MSRSSLPFYANDISAVARSLNGQLSSCDHTPGHLELLNMLARSIGCRNYQHYRAQVVARESLAMPKQPARPVDYVELQRLIKYFDAAGRLIRWPSKFSHREPCLWVLWSKLPPKRALSEDEINQFLRTYHLFGDPALLRRELADAGMVKRTADCREYRRVEKRPPAEAVALIRLLNAQERKGGKQ
jgi:hypothetical protein